MFAICGTTLELPKLLRDARGTIQLIPVTEGSVRGLCCVWTWHLVLSARSQSQLRKNDQAPSCRRKASIVGLLGIYITELDQGSSTWCVRHLAN
jgi:hypothetical protein